MGSGLIHGHGLCEIAWTVGVETFEDSEVVGEELEGDVCEETGENAVFWDENGVSRDSFGEFWVVGDDDGFCATGTNFFGGGSHEGTVLVVKNTQNDGGVFDDEGEWTVLQCSAGIPFGVKVGDFFDFECAFSGDCFAGAFAENETVFGVDECFCNCFAGFFCREGDFDEGGESAEFVDEFSATVDFGGAMLAEPGGDEFEGDDLSAECFGGCDGVFTAGVEVDSAFRRSGDERADGVDHGEGRDVMFLCHDDGAMGVFGFAGLRDDEETRVRWGEVMGSDF